MENVTKVLIKPFESNNLKKLCQYFVEIISKKRTRKFSISLCAEGLCSNDLLLSSNEMLLYLNNSIEILIWQLGYFLYEYHTYKQL